MARTLVVGATGHLGQEIVKACVKQGHEVHALVRTATRRDSIKMKPLQASGATIHEGDLHDYDSVVNACRAVDTVVSAIGSFQIGDEGPLVKAVSNGFFSYWAFSLGDLTRLGGPLPPDEVNVYGGGNVKGALASVPDVAAVTARALADPAMRNREIRMTANTTTQNELIAAWERRSGRSVKKVPVSAAEVDRIIAASAAPDQAMTMVVMQLLRSMWIRGDSVKTPPTSVEARDVYPDMHYQTVEEALSALR